MLPREGSGGCAGAGSKWSLRHPAFVWILRRAVFGKRKTSEQAFRVGPPKLSEEAELGTLPICCHFKSVGSPGMSLAFRSQATSVSWLIVKGIGQVLPLHALPPKGDASSVPIMMRRHLLSLVLLLGSLLLNTDSVKAAHYSGGSITYECLGGNMYRITLDVFLDCSGVAITSQSLNFTNSCGVSFTLNNIPQISCE